MGIRRDQYETVREMNDLRQGRRGWKEMNDLTQGRRGWNMLGLVPKIAEAWEDMKVVVNLNVIDAGKNVAIYEEMD